MPVELAELAHVIMGQPAWDGHTLAQQLYERRLAERTSWQEVPDWYSAQDVVRDGSRVSGVGTCETVGMENPAQYKARAVAYLNAGLRGRASNARVRSLGRVHQRCLAITVSLLGDA